jgi:hypothetical protein
MERSRLLAWVLVLALTVPLAVTAQQGGPAATFTPEQLEQVAAPIALYPDPLLAQVLMASTYPLEVVQATRFLKDNPNLKGDQLNEKLKDQTWDDSVKSLVEFPEVLTLMDGKLDWVQKLGDAFLAQQKDLLAAVQRLRARAQAQGNLKSTPQQTVAVQPAAPVTVQPSQPQTVVVQQPPATVITIEPTNPQVVYVPSYNPTVVYGAWPYPAAPPKRDGLYWPTNPGEPPSPLGPFVAKARGEGYSKSSSAPVPYWGYYFRILTAQGKDAPGGAYDYLAHGRLLGGFALVAYPAQYGVSGVMTFIVNQDGVVYQKDLGPNSASLARAMKQFNPDSTWQKV